ncbi:hypothetical protein RhiirC2_793601, partial [Rhizophagus irregularis]
MEGVESTAPQTSGSNIASSSSQTIISQTVVENESSLNTSMHAPSTAEQTVANKVPSGQIKSKQQEWTVIEKPKQFPLFFPIAILPGQNPTEKKNHAYRQISDVSGLKSYVIATMKGIKVVKATYETEEQAVKVTQREIVKNNPTRFGKLDGISQSQDNQSQYELRIWDVPLDIEKDLFEQYLHTVGKVVSIKFNLKQLYYEVVVVFADKALEQRFKTEWVLRFCKNIFRVFPSSLTREERNHRFKYVLKLANLPAGTCASDLIPIANETNAKAIFLPKNKFSKNYEKERFAWFYFDSEQGLLNVKDKKFSYNNKGLSFVEKNAITCHICGSPYHRLRG